MARHLQIGELGLGCCHSCWDIDRDSAVSTPRDIRRIHKTNAGSEVVRKLVICAEEHEKIRDWRVLGGIFLIIRDLIKDSKLAAEVYSQRECYVCPIKP